MASMKYHKNVKRWRVFWHITLPNGEVDIYYREGAGEVLAWSSKTYMGSVGLNWGSCNFVMKFEGELGRESYFRLYIQE